MCKMHAILCPRYRKSHFLKRFLLIFPTKSVKAVSTPWGSVYTVFWWFLPGLFYEIFVFPVCFGGFSRGRGNSYRESFIKSLFSRFFSLVSDGEGAIRTGIWLWNSSFPGLFRWFHTFTFIIFYKLMFYHILHKLIN